MIEPERDAPDLEDLAAYLDGRLSDELKARVEERLARDEDYYEVFVENVRFHQEEESRLQQEDGGGEVVAPAAWWRSRRVAAAAAVLVAAIGLTPLISGPSTEELTAQLDAAAIVRMEGWTTTGWRVYRGDGKDYQRQALAFRLGTRAIDLRVALAADDAAAAILPAGQLAMWSSDDEVLLLLSPELTSLREEIGDGDLEAATARIKRLDSQLEKFLGAEARYYALGRWNETGRLAALAGDAKVLRGIYRQRRVARDVEEIEPHLADLEKALAEPSPDFAAAGQAFSEIARTLGGRG